MTPTCTDELSARLRPPIPYCADDVVGALPAEPGWIVRYTQDANTGHPGPFDYEVIAWAVRNDGALDPIILSVSYGQRPCTASEVFYDRPGRWVTRRAELPEVKKRRRRMTDDRLREISEVYRNAEKAGSPPRLAVAEHLGIAPDTASKWLRAAEGAGFLNRSGGDEEVTA